MRSWMSLVGAITMLGMGFGLLLGTRPTVAAVSGAAPLVVIDPGHGGRDPGTVHDALLEKHLNWAVAEDLGQELRSRGLRVFFTRAEDQGVVGNVMQDLSRRADVANQLHARLFISIHVNSEPSGTASGPIVYYSPYSPSSHTLASRISSELWVISRPHWPPRPLRQWVLLRTQMPGANVEIGFLSSALDRARLVQSSYQQQLADAITRGILQDLGMS